MQIGFKDYTPDWREYSVILLTFMSKDQVPLVMIVCEHRSAISGELIEKEELWKLMGPRWLQTLKRLCCQPGFCSIQYARVPKDGTTKEK